MDIIEEVIATVKFSATYATKLNAKIQIEQYIKNLKVQSDYFKKPERQK